MSKSILVPIPLVKRIIELLGYWDTSNYDYFIHCERCDILHALDLKLQKLDLRDTYVKIITADSEDSRDDARINYLRQRAKLNNLIADDYDV